MHVNHQMCNWLEKIDSYAQKWYQIHSTILQSWQAVHLICIHELPG